MRDLGELGQSQFYSLCVSKGIIANPSVVDKRGWDYHLEIPIERERGDASSMHKSSLECRVQIKSTEKGRLKQEVEYSNLLSMATYSSPSFYVLLEFEEGADFISRIYIKHVDEEFTRNLLQKMRERELFDQDFKSNSSKKSIVFDESEQLEEVSSGHLKDALLKFIGVDYDDYVLSKKQYLKTVGYEDGCASVELTIEGVENIEAMSDMLLGLEGSMVVSKFVAHEKRFGLKSKVPLIDLEKGMLEITRTTPNWSGNISIRGNSRSPALTFSCEGFFDLMDSRFPPVRMLVKSEYFSVFINEHKYNANCTLAGDVEIPLRKLVKLMAAMKFMRQDGCIVELTDIKLGSLAVCTIRREINDVNGTFELPAQAQFIADSFDILDDVDVSLDALRNVGDRLVYLFRLLSPKYHPVKCSLEEVEVQCSRVACLSIIDVFLGSYRLVGFFVVAGDVSESNKIIGHPVLVEKLVWPRSYINFEEELEGTISKIVREYGSDHIVYWAGLTNDQYPESHEERVAYVRF